MNMQNYILIAVTIPIISTGLILWAKARKAIMILEEIRKSLEKKQGS